MPITAQDLLNAVVDTNALETTVTPVPEGVFIATVLKYETMVFPNKKDIGGTPYYMLKVTFRITDPEVAELIKRDNPQVTMAIFLTLTPTGAVDAFNVDLGRLLAAADGKELGVVALSESLDSIKGVDVVVTVVHETRASDDDSGEEPPIYAQVKKVAHINTYEV